MKNIILLVFIFLVDYSASAQIVDIESRRIQADSVRFVFRGSLSSSHNDNNGDYIFSLKGNIATQVKSKNLKSIFLLIGDYGLISNGNQDFMNQSLLHLRYNYKISSLLQTEVFVQSQNNQLLDVNNRNLIGGGLRLKVVSKDNVRLFFGNSYMYVIETSDIIKKSFYNHRNSSYLSLAVAFPKSKLEINNTLYYQPQYSNFSDYTITEQFRLDVGVSSIISIFTQFNYYFDSRTPENRRQYASLLSLGIGIKL